MKRFLVDSDFLVAVFRDGDPNHTKAKNILRSLSEQTYVLWAIHLVKQESATVISHRVGMDATKLFVKNVMKDIDQWIQIDEKLEEKAWEIFLSQTKKGTSFIDCANLAALHYYNLTGILTFDHFYPKKLRINADT